MTISLDNISPTPPLSSILDDLRVRIDSIEQALLHDQGLEEVYQSQAIMLEQLRRKERQLVLERDYQKPTA